jgi:HPt (histidine-containing phosphotransfer) domain-containing protein
VSTTSLIDLATFQELRETAGAAFVAELIDTFFEEAPVLLVELRAARDAAAAQRFQRAAHSLKSNAQTFGGTVLGALARELELGGLDSASDDRLQALDVAWQRAAAALKGLQHG